MKMLNATVVFDNYSLREGPGRLFERVNMYNTSESLTVIAREPGNNWVFVQVNSDYRSGWMNTVGLDIIGDIKTLPFYEVNDVQIIHGHVYLSNGEPATKIGVSIAPNVNDLTASSDVCETNDEGEWYLYFPADVQGAFIVGPNSYGCEGSTAVNTADGNCTLKGSFPPPVEIGLPYGGTAIDFEIIP
jgi:hypothetical protein